MSTVNIKRGIEFRRDLYQQADRTAWLDAVGQELSAKGLTIKLGDGSTAKDVKDSASLRAALKEVQAQAAAGNASLRAYLTDLMQGLDDVVKGSVRATPGDVFDFSSGSDLSKALGIGDAKRGNYAALSTEFGKAAKVKPEATMSVGGVTIQLKAPPAPPIDLSTIPHMSAQTMLNAPATYGRDGEEVEDTRVVTGLSKTEAVALAGNALNDLQRSKAAAGLNLGVAPLDELNWDSEAHALRRANPYVSFTLDSRSLELNPNSGQPRVAVGRDFFFDTFMAKKNLATGTLTKDLQAADLMYRTRIRYGSDRDPFTGTRVLIGMKQGTAIDADGTKHAKKIDSRSDSASQALFDGLTRDAQTGKLGLSWSWAANAVAPAASSVYRTAVQRGITDDVGGETGVLALEPAAVARQIRGRFHLNETNQSAVLQAFASAGEPRIQQLVDLIGTAPDWAAQGNLPSKDQLLAQAKALLDRSSIVAAAAEGLKKIDPTLTVDRTLIDRLWPQARVASKRDAKLQRAVADAIRAEYDAFADNVDAAQRKIGANEDRAIRDAGSAEDVRGYLRLKAATARFMAFAQSTPGTGAVLGNSASFTAYAKRLIDMPDSREKTDLLQNIGVGLDHLRALNDASFSSVVQVAPALAKKQTFDAYLTEFDSQLQGATRDAFLAELGDFLSQKNSPALKAAPDKGPVAADLRKNLVAAHAEVLQRMVGAAGAWAQAAWFNSYRRQALGIDPQAWNFVIASMDYSEFYDAKTGEALTFQERVSRRPLDPAKMTGAMVSNDFQIELQAEEAYTGAIRNAQYGVNGAVAGLLMDYALSQGTPGFVAGDAEGFEKWFSGQMALPPAEKKAFAAQITGFARSKGSPIDVEKSLEPLAEQERAVRLLVGFARQKNPSLNVADRSAVEHWYRSQVGTLSMDQLNDFLTEVAQYAATQKSEVPLSPNLLRTLDFKPFAGTNVGRPVDGHTALFEDLQAAQEVWAMVKQSQRDLSLARGREVQRVLRDNNLRNKGWEPPTKPKGDYAIDFALP